MNYWKCTIRFGSVVGLLCLGACAPAGTPTAVVRDAPRYTLPGVYHPDKKEGGGIDCNNPAHWDGSTMYVFSSQGAPWRTSGPDLMNLERQSKACAYDNKVNGGRWIEATHKADDGKLYGWYHREPGGLCPDTHPTAPLIGAVVSTDNGLHWHDLDIVSEAPADSRNCGTPNKYFAGGNGDFCVNVDRQKQYVYFFISTYNKNVAEQGVSVARMRYADRDNPVGKVWKWCNGEWKEPALGGHVTQIFPAQIDWHREDARVFWGASVHWNTHVKQWVMLLNLSKDKDWTQEGVYVTFNTDMSNPRGWSVPVKILEPAVLGGSKWYPQVIGTDVKNRETDKLASRTARLFVAGISKWEIVLQRPGEAGTTTPTQ